MIAVTSFCVKSNPQFSSALSDKTVIVNGINPSAEEIAALNPDLIVSVSNSSMEFVENMRKLGFPVVVFGNESLETILSFIHVMGVLTGQEKNANHLHAALQERLRKIDDHVLSIPLEKRPRSLIMFDLAGGGAGGRGSFMGDILERAGGRNLAAETGARWPILSPEWIMLQDPDVIILDDYRGGDELDQAMLIFKDQISQHPLFGKLSAIRQNHLHIIGDHLIVIPGPRAVDAVERTHLILYPDIPNVSSRNTPSDPPPHPHKPLPFILPVMTETIPYALEVEIDAAGYTHPILSHCHIKIPHNAFCCIVGANGSGKSTFLKSILELLPLNQSNIRVQGLPFHRIPLGQRARLVSYMLQKLDLSFSFTSEEIVSFGRYPHAGMLSSKSLQDQILIDRAMEMAGVSHLRARRIDELSGGEFQRVLLAKSLAQETPLLLLDEPTAHMDLGHQVQTYQLLRNLIHTGQKTVVSVCHDLNLASEFADLIVLIHEGKIRASGSPAEILTEEHIALMSGSPHLKVSPSPFTGQPHIYITPH
nr:helical backbone metal receptor [Oscillatoria laete-virens]